jgi:diadenosine tetraphosphate (Ap4A) HIT family hydrolase
VVAGIDVMKDFRETFRLDELTIQDRQGWTLSVRPAQITLGSMVVSSTAGHLDFQAIEHEEAMGLTAAFADAERVAKAALGAVRINIVCLMMKDPVVHFHVLPRYDHVAERYGATWRDADWPGPPTFGPAPTADTVLRSIVRELRASI